MASLNELAYDTLEDLKANSISDDNDLDLRRIKYHWHNQRALFIKNEYNKPGRIMEEALIQDLGCVELEVVDAAECCLIETDCTILRTKVKLPERISIRGFDGISRVGPVVKTQLSWNKIPYAAVPYTGNGKYNQTMIYVFELNDYLYFKVGKKQQLLLKWANVRILAANPEDVALFTVCSSTNPCYTDDMEYPIPTWMIPYIKEQVLKQLGVSMQIPKDISNDAADITE